MKLKATIIYTVSSERTCCIMLPSGATCPSKLRYFPLNIIRFNMQSIPPVTQSSSVVYTTKVQRGALEAQGYVRASHLGLRIISSTARRGYAKLCQIAQTDSTVGLIKTELKPSFPNVSNMSCENDEKLRECLEKG